jgi:hypothetical protein
MPDSFGKRNRDAVKAKKAAAHDERRVARNLRRNQRDGFTPERPPVEPTDDRARQGN